MKERNHGIDLLRIFSMLMVLALHLMSRSFISANAAGLPHYYFGWLLEVFSYCAVNCYAIISGFVAQGKKVKYSNLLYLLIQVSLYQVIFTVLEFILAVKPFSLKTLLSSTLPFGNWFIVAYFGMFLFSPFYNFFIEKAHKNVAKIFLLTGTIAFCIIPALLKTDLLGLDWGYHFIWLSFLFILGAYIKKYNPFSSIKKGFFLIGYIVGSLFLYSTKCFEWISPHIPLPGTSYINSYLSILINYNSPIVLFNAICLVLLFSKIKIKTKFSQKSIALFSSVSFGVFLLHIKDLIREPLMNWFSFTLNTPLLFAIPLAFALIIAEYLFCGLIDYIRIKIFNLFRIRKLCVLIENLFKSIVKKIFNLKNPHQQDQAILIDDAIATPQKSIPSTGESNNQDNEGKINQ